MLEQFLRQNRWWSDPATIVGDRHLVRMNEARFAWTPSLPFRFDHDSIFTLRGPRQVGKSTVLKRQIKHLLDDGWPARKILYLDVELAGLETSRDLVRALREYLDSETSPAAGEHGRWAIFLDEVTRVENWAGALRGLVDNDELKGVTIVATGSHTRDLRAGGERLPGRRGGGAKFDFELFPLSFREFAALVEPELQLPPAVQSLERDEIHTSSLARQLLRPRLMGLFHRYLETGGFLPALNDRASHGMVRAETFHVYREAIVGEFTRAGMREQYLREVVNWLARHLGQEFDYRDIAADTDIGSKDTARNYVDNMEAAYVVRVYYRTPSLVKLSPAFRGPKKLHPMDPLFWHLIHAWAASDPDPWAASLAALQDPDSQGRLVESVVAVHLRRAFGAQVFYWRIDNRREIDFVVGQPQNAVSLIEVKHQHNVDEHDVRELAVAGGGLVATRGWEGERAGGKVYGLPAAELLAIMDAPSLAPCR